MKIIKWFLLGGLSIGLILVAMVLWLLYASLPSLDGEFSSQHLRAPTTLSRDELGSAIIQASSEYDAAYALGYAHGQDRLFQMDLLRRQAAGELSQLVGDIALARDKQHRVHQFRQRANKIFESLPQHQKTLLQSYTAGVNEAAESLTTKPPEYYLLSASFKPWTVEDSLLVSFSMYLDLQGGQIEIDFRLTALKAIFGDEMLAFFTLPSRYQAAIDLSEIPLKPVKVPELNNQFKQHKDTVARLQDYEMIEAMPDIGSNNWAVSGALTQSQAGMLSNDMHLGLSVPAIWYRAQLNYTQNNEEISITGVTLPGTPAIVVGSTQHVAWGFTNSGIDNVDWIELSESTPITSVSETIKLKNGKQETFTFQTSEYGPVRQLLGKHYALSWVAHQPYALNMRLADLGKAKNIDEALETANKVRIPVQNLVLADADGDVAWQLMGSISGRPALARHAISEKQYNPLWKTAEINPAKVVRPKNGKVWSANARMVSTEDLGRYGDGGYALGARQQQIVSSLLAGKQFTERDFYDIHLDNRALFLSRWHDLLLKTLQDDPMRFAIDIEILQQWDACACEDSVAYTLVRHFRTAVISSLLKPVNDSLKQHELSMRHILRSIEPAIWAIIEQQPKAWLPPVNKTYEQFLQEVYAITKTRLLTEYQVSGDNYEAIAWGEVNKLKIKHPFASSLGAIGYALNMPEISAFGDSYMPAVQATDFGASQRLIVRPDRLDKAILTLPGGQSGHFLSDFYAKGFIEYASHQNTPLLPGKVAYKINFTPLAN